MSLTEEEKNRMNAQVCELEIIKELQKNDEQLKYGQQCIQEHLNEVDRRLEDGSKVMKGLITDVKEVFDLVEHNADKSAERHREAMQGNADLKIEIKDNKYKDMSQDLKESKRLIEKKDKEIKEGKRKRWDLLKIVISGIVSLIVGGLLVRFFG